MTNITLLDGGMGQELVHRTGDKPTPLWATRIMVDHPGVVQSVHADYFAAGATIATTNSYAVHHDRLVGSDLENQFTALLDLAVKEAKQARAAHGSGRIAGAIGPLGASYRPDLHPDAKSARDLFAELVGCIVQDVDLLIFETVVSLDHARDALASVQGTGVPVWLSISVDDQDGSRLRSGEPVADVLAIAQAGGAAALLVNCSAPEAISTALEILKSSTVPIGGYANGFEQISAGFLEDNPTVDALSARRDLDPAAYADHVMHWVDLGALIVGGCCEVGPAHIAEIAARLKAAGHTIV